MTLARPVQELLRNDGVAGRQLLFEASDRRGREQRVAAQELEAEDVGPVVDLRGPEHVPARAGDVRDSQADISKARRLLGWTPRVALREGLERTVAYYRARRQLYWS